MPQRGVTGAETVECDAAAKPPQRVDKARRLFYVAECRRFGDLDDQAPRKFGTVAQKRDQQPQPWPVASSQPGDVEAEPDLGVRRQLFERRLHNVTVDPTDQTEFLNGADELASRHHALFLI